MKLWLNTLLRLFAGTYFVLSSMYCLLTFLPYTYFFLIKAPPYPWMPWFVRHQAGLFWISAALVVAANWKLREAWVRRDRRFFVGAGLWVAAGIYLTLRPFLIGIEDHWPAYWWSLASLVPLAGVAFWKDDTSAESADDGDGRELSFGYSVALLIALAVSVVYVAGARITLYRESHTLSFHAADAELTLWSLLSHLALALVVASVVNLGFLLAARTAKPQPARRRLIGVLIFGSLWAALFHFLEDALSFGGWQAHVYAASLALGLTLWGFSLVLPFLEQSDQKAVAASGRTVLSQIGTWAALAGLCGIAVAFPFLISGADWSGFLESTVTLLVWVAVSVSVYRLRPARAKYSAAALILVLVASAAVYKTLVFAEIFWSKPLGATDDEISMALDAYGGRDNSFHLANYILGSGRRDVCGDLCRILREYTNIRDTQARTDIRLVDQLQPAQGPRPNIFVFVIDSMRPDYLGAYNPRATYTPNLDAFARDSIVMHNVFSQYSGTSLSEPAIWTGAEMLHAHYVQPFSRLNSLDRMLHADGYSEIVSWDEVLSAILAGDGVVKLDTDKKLWNAFEIGSTLQQARAVLDARTNPGQPVFFYAQPKDVHQFARNTVPSPTAAHWQSPAGLNARITYEVHWVDSRLGEFFDYLKQHGLYDNSVIIVTSDHGDATGEFGRSSHSIVVWPEIMRVPLIIHVPAKMRERLVYDDSRISTLTDITPTLYYLLGHRPISQNALYGRPLLAETREELNRYPSKDLLLASDVRAVYGILTADGRYFYTTYDSPAKSYLFDLVSDYNGEHNIVTPALKQRYDEEIIQHLRLIGDYYGYKPGVGSLLASAER